MLKADAMSHWQGLPADVNPLESMEAIPYKAKGSRYGACGVRVDGSPAFVDAVLGRLKGLLDGENQVTRLELSRQAVKPTNGVTGKAYANRAGGGAEVCYIRLHVRGAEGAVASSVFDRHLDGATERFARAQGLE